MAAAATPGDPGTSDIEVGPLDLAARVDEALAVQAVAFGLGQDEIDVRRHIVLRHLENPHARALGATTPSGRLVGFVYETPRSIDLGRLVVGFVYGLPNDRAHWWSTVVEPYLRATGSQDWLDDAFVITELHVHPDFQQRGIGRRLITMITDAVDQPRSILSAIETESPARSLYRSLGYRDLALHVLFPSAPRPYVVMGAPLPLPPG